MGHHRRSLSAASAGTDCTEFHDAPEALADLDSAHEEADGGAACGAAWPAGADEAHEAQEARHAPCCAQQAAVDWYDEQQMLAPNHLSVEAREAAIHSLRKIVLAEPDAGARPLRACSCAAAAPSASAQRAWSVAGPCGTPWAAPCAAAPTPGEQPRPLSAFSVAVYGFSGPPRARSPAAACAGLEDRSAAALERFLRARKYDVAVAAAMYLEHRRWRAAFAPTPWVQGPGDVAAQLEQRKVAMQGLCRDGMPFVIVVARSHRPTGREGVPELHRAFVFIMDCITAAAGPGGQFRILVDLRNMTTANADLNAMKVAFEVLQKGFPERYAPCASGSLLILALKADSDPHLGVILAGWRTCGLRSRLASFWRSGS